MKDRVKDIEFSIRKISQKASEKEDCVRFDIGQPSFDTPEHVKEKVKKELEKEQGYTQALGLKELRKAIIKEEKQKNNISKSIPLEKQNVGVTTGGMGALYSVLTTLLTKKDIVVYNDPCWVPYKLISNVNGNKYKQVNYFNRDGDLRDQAVDKIKKAKAVVVNTPSNPTGKMLTEEQAREIGEVAQDHSTFLISDEVYHQLTFDRDHYSPAAYNPESVVIGSVSKNHAMTGWRIGWMISRKEYLDEFIKLSRATVAASSKIGQLAAKVAIEDNHHIKRMRKEYHERRDLVTKKMDELGWSFVQPEGAIYTFPDIGRDSKQFCMDMMDKGVSMVPGEYFGPNSDTNVRICFGSTPKPRIKKAFNRIKE